MCENEHKCDHNVCRGNTKTLKISVGGAGIFQANGYYFTVIGSFDL